MFTLSGDSLLVAYAAIGLLLGLTLERGRFCFVSAFRDVFMFKNPWLLNGILISIGSAAIAIGILSDLMGTRPVMLDSSWLVVVGGLIFGIGIALAGACASGMLFRIPEGYVGNLLELVGFSAGILLWAAYLQVPLKQYYSAPVGVYSTLGVRADVYSFVTGTAFLLLALYLNRYVPKKEKRENEPAWTLNPKRPWDPRLAGLILAGIVVVMFSITPRSLLGFTAPYATFGAWTLSVFGVSMKSVSWMSDYLGVYPLVVLTLAAFVGAGAGAGVGKNFRIRVPKNRFRLIQGTFGGVLAGLGSGIGIGCNIGNFYVGFAERMDVSALLFAPGLILGIYLGFKLSTLL